ncbi:MAG: hypothetical protein HFI44_00270 [Lachnospiraceae bacterium]|jgi:hypothetical protein|nr:hypothetical protein [Lachnospiraceae bacterium]
MNKSEFKDLVGRIHQSTMKADKQEVRERFDGSENVLLIASVGRLKFCKLMAFLERLDHLKKLSIWAQEEYRECVQDLNNVLIEFINHEGKYTAESIEFELVERKKPYDIIVFCIDKVNQYRNLNLESICSKLNYDSEAIIYSFDCVEQFVRYLDIDNHIELIEEYKEAIDSLI